MSFGESKECICLECRSVFPHAKKLSEHFKKTHKMSPVDYCLKHNYAGERPTCIECGGETRFVSFVDGYRKYCKEHKRVAEAVGGRVGGRIKKQWNRGLTKASDERVAKLAIKQTGTLNAFFGKKHSKATKDSIAVTKRFTPDEVRNKFEAKGDVIVVGGIAEIYKTYDDRIDISCVVCNTHDVVSLHNYMRCWRCRTCYPIASHPQLEIVDFVKSLGFTDVHVSTRQIITPLELDVWVPEKNVAVEYHGLYWHSGGKNDVFDKARHRQKYDMCRALGIKLMQFFSDEWMFRGDTCRSMLTNALNRTPLLLNARDCDVVTLMPAQSKEFVEKNHISGSTRASHHIGLMHPQYGLVAVATTRKPVQKKHGNLCELARMCFLSGTNVRGAASKLLKRVDELARLDGFEGILSYADLRFGDGGVYEKWCGFELVDEQKMSYGYTDGQRRFNRFKFRAQPGKTEKQVADENGVRPVWGCGNKIYVKRFV
jgi:hypothetical protein